jgi:hypothetical protein
LAFAFLNTLAMVFGVAILCSGCNCGVIIRCLWNPCLTS